MKSSPNRFAPPGPLALLSAFWLSAALTACGAAGAPARPASAQVLHEAGSAELLAQGREAAARGDGVRAEQYLALALTRGADPSQALPLLLQTCLSNARLRAALNYAEPHLLTHPDDDALRYLVATIQMGLGEYGDARTTLAQLLERNPTSAEGHYLLGVLDADREPRAAASHFRTYLALAPDGRHAPEVRSRLSELLIQEKLLNERSLSVVEVPKSGALSPALVDGGDDWLEETPAQVETPQ